MIFHSFVFSVRFRTGFNSTEMNQIRNHTGNDMHVYFLVCHIFNYKFNKLHIFHHTLKKQECRYSYKRSCRSQTDIWTLINIKRLHIKY